LNGLNALFICVYKPIGQSWIKQIELMFFVVGCASGDAGSQHAPRRTASHHYRVSHPGSPHQI
jgi:hypothetical protein